MTTGIKDPAAPLRGKLLPDTHSESRAIFSDGSNMSNDVEICFNWISYERFLTEIEALAVEIESGSWRPDFIVGIGRGGLVPGAFLSHRMGIALLSIDHSSKVYDFAESLLVHLAGCTRKGERYLFVDDINDSGKTIGYLRQTLRENDGDDGNVRFAVLIDNLSSSERVNYASSNIDRTTNKEWFVFPWEAVAPTMALTQDALEEPARLSLPDNR